MENFLRTSASGSRTATVPIMGRAESADAGNVDQFYRYQMPRLKLKHEGRGKNARTVIENLKDVARALRTSPAYIGKFISVKVGARTNVDKQTGAVRVKGTHTDRDLAELVQDFIEIFVLCGSEKCRKPELVVSIDSKRKSVDANCATCGWAGELGAGHKVSRFMLKSPPSKAQTIEWTNVRAAANASESQNSNDGCMPMRNVPTSSDEHADAFDEDDSWHDDASADAASKRRSEEMKAMGVEEEHAGAPKRELDVTHISRDKLGKETRLNALREMLVSRENRNDEEDCAVNCSESSILEVISTIRRLDEDHAGVTRIVMESIFDSGNPQGVAKKLQAHKDVLQAVVSGTDDIAEVAGVDSRASQALFLEEFEERMHDPKLTKRVPIFLQKLYELDILEEDALMAWWTPKGCDVDNAVRCAARTFIEWLHDAAEDSEFDEE